MDEPTISGNKFPGFVLNVPILTALGFRLVYTVGQRHLTPDVSISSRNSVIQHV
jgi:hypothetical protein